MSHRWQHTAIAAAVGVALVATVAAQPGPAWLWATDGCPASEIACGHPPIGLVVLGGVVVAGNLVVERVGEEVSE